MLCHKNEFMVYATIKQHRDEKTNGTLNGDVTGNVTGQVAGNGDVNGQV